MTVHYSPAGKYTVSACGQEHKITTDIPDEVSCLECLDYLALSEVKAGIEAISNGYVMGVDYGYDAKELSNE